MPMPVDKLEHEGQPLEEQILDLLRRNPGQGYLDTEIWRELNGLSAAGAALYMIVLSADLSMGELEPYREALADLERRGAVRRFKHNGVNYYAAAS